MKVKRSLDVSLRGASESVPRTLLTVTAVALVCSAMVSGAVHFLRPVQTAYELLERNRTIVTVAYGPGMRSDADVVQAFLALDARVLDLQTNEYVAVADAHGFDHWSDVKVEQGGAVARRVPVYFVTRDDARALLVVPVDGPGMWSTLQGYVGLQADLTHIASVGIYRHGETPGIGDRIEAPAWLDNWPGNRLFDAAGNAAPPEIDLIAGATITSRAMLRLVSHWFDDTGYGPWLANLRADQPAMGEGQ